MNTKRQFGFSKPLDTFLGIQWNGFTYQDSFDGPAKGQVGTVGAKSLEPCKWLRIITCYSPERDERNLSSDDFSLSRVANRLSTPLNLNLPI